VRPGPAAGARTRTETVTVLTFAGDSGPASESESRRIKLSMLMFPGHGSWPHHIPNCRRHDQIIPDRHDVGVWVMADSDSDIGPSPTVGKLLTDER
jgi:hypothetical protein